MLLEENGEAKCWFLVDTREPGSPNGGAEMAGPHGAPTFRTPLEAHSTHAGCGVFCIRSSLFQSQQMPRNSSFTGEHGETRIPHLHGIRAALMHVVAGEYGSDP